MLNPRDETGRELDAKFAIERVPGGFALTVESRGGSDHGPNPSRNKNYIAGLMLHLRRMAENNFLLTEIQIASSKAMKLPEAERKVWPKGYPRPLQMSGVIDFNALRLAIGRESANFQNISNSSGNNSKRIRLITQSPEAAAMSLVQLEAVFTGVLDASPWTEEPTTDEEELRKRVSNARRKARKNPGKRLKPPRGQDDVKRANSTSERFVRDPNVIAWVLEEAAGRYEACGEKAPFERQDGEPYLEVHHVRPLAEGGPDRIDNAIACCPNCYRNLHHGSDRQLLRKQMFDRLSRLADWPYKTVKPSN